MIERPLFVVAVVFLATLAGCRTPRSGSEIVEPVVTAPVGTFEPVAPVARLNFAGGRYPDLYDSSSYAVWVTPDVVDFKESLSLDAGEAVEAELSSDAAVINENYTIIECHLHSVFSDSSIAYDVVWFRNIEVYVQLPNGSRIRPVLTLEDRSVTEESVGALRRYSRTNLLVFPRKDFWIGEPVIAPDSPKVRLVFEGYNTSFEFGWTGLPHASDMSPQEQHLRKAGKIAQMGFNEFYSRVRALAHVFD